MDIERLDVPVLGVDKRIAIHCRHVICLLRADEILVDSSCQRRLEVSLQLAHIAVVDRMDLVLGSGVTVVDRMKKAFRGLSGGCWLGPGVFCASRFLASGTYGGP